MVMWEVEASCGLDLVGSHQKYRGIECVLSQASVTASFAKSTSNLWPWSTVHGHLSLSLGNQSGALALARPLF